MDESGSARLLGHLTRLQTHVAEAVARRRSDDPAPDDPFRGLYLADEVIDHLLDRPGEGEPVDTSRLARLARVFELSDLDVELLLIALAPDVDSRFERFYGYLNDDVTRRRASIGLALELCRVSPADPDARARLTRGAPLLDGGLVTVEDRDRPFLTRALRVPDRVIAHLLGDDRPDEALPGLLSAGMPFPVGDCSPLRGALESGLRLTYIQDVPGGAGQAMAVAAVTATGRLPLVLDLTRLAAEPDPIAPLAAIGREVRLHGAALVAGPLEAMGERVGAVVHELADLPVTELLFGRLGWDPGWTRQVPLVIDVTPVGRPERVTLWRTELGDRVNGGLDVAAVTAPYLLAPEQIARAARAAAIHADYEGEPLQGRHIRFGARAQNAGNLDRLARRITPGVGWDDLVLPRDAVEQLRELVARARQRDQVLGEWRMRPGGGRGRGVTALFAGDSGTGKTMSAEVVAGELGLDLYTINLATVVDKYIGETEKNLDRLFTEAAGVNGVLLFDEADAIFGKRSEVRDAHDRYANIESAFLLQRMESFDGLAVLATNLRANLDEAFTRRLDMIVDFPIPDERQRRALWEHCLGSRMPRSQDLDLDFCAKAFELSGGNIRSIALTAAYLAADAGRAVAMADVIRAVQREYRKLGRLCLDSEFGPYAHLTRADV